MPTFGEQFKRDAEAHGLNSGSGDWFKLQEGENLIRVMTEPVIMFEKFKVGICYTNCGYEGTPRYLTYILDRKDNKIKLFKMPYSIAKHLSALSEDEDYRCETYPMTYDIKINAKGAGKKEVEYTVMAKLPKEIEQSAIDEVAKQTPVIDIIEKMKEKQKEKIKNNPDLIPKQETQRVVDEENVIEYPEEDNNLEDIPF